MKKYVSSEFVATKYGIYKAEQDIITSFPSSIIANGGNVTPWAIYGNENNGDYVGDKTINLWNNLGFSANSIFSPGVHTTTNTHGTTLSTSTGGSVEITQIASGGNINYQNGYFFIEIDLSQFEVGDNFTISFDYLITNKLSTVATTIAYVGQQSTSTNIIADWSKSGRAVIPVTLNNTMTYPYAEIRLCGNSINVTNVQINRGSDAQPYEPYGYKIPLSCGENNYTIYMTDVLRKSSGLDPVYDVASSSGSITRNVDTDGTPLDTPTTESFMPPTIATAAGNNIINFGTTVKPSKMELTYTGWHMYDDKKRTGGEWS